MMKILFEIKTFTFRIKNKTLTKPVTELIKKKDYLLYFRYTFFIIWENKKYDKSRESLLITIVRKIRK